MVGAGLVDGAEAEQGLEAGKGSAAAVVSEDELVEVDLEVFRGDAVVGALEPGLEVGERAVRARQYPLPIGEACALLVRPVIEAGRAETAVAGPAVGVDDRSGSDARAHKRGQRGGRGIVEQLQAESPRASATHLDRDPDERLASRWRPPRRSVSRPPRKPSSTSTSPVNASRSSITPGATCGASSKQSRNGRYQAGDATAGRSTPGPCVLTRYAARKETVSGKCVLCITVPAVTDA